MKSLIQKKYLIAIVPIICVLIISLFIGFNHDDKVEADSIVKEEIKTNNIALKEEENAEEEFYVDIKGEVKKPGVYKVSSKMIVNDAIKLAGGLTSKANTDNINLSTSLKKEMVIYVFSKKDVNKIIKMNDTPCTCETIEVNNCVKDDEPTGNETDTIKSKININSATKEELIKLTGIGEAKADAIIEYRKEKRFERIEDIKNISGIGDAMFDKIKEDITV